MYLNIRCRTTIRNLLKCSNSTTSSTSSYGFLLLYSSLSTTSTCQPPTPILLSAVFLLIALAIADVGYVAHGLAEHPTKFLGQDFCNSTMAFSVEVTADDGSSTVVKDFGLCTFLEECTASEEYSLWSALQPTGGASAVVYSVTGSAFEAAKVTSILWLVSVLAKLQDAEFDVKTLLDDKVETVVALAATYFAFA